LFLIYINYLDDSILDWILKFADTKIFGSVKSLEQHYLLQDDLNALLVTVVQRLADAV